MTLEEFYVQAHNQPPFDLASNPLGFNRTSQTGYSEQSAHMPILRYFASLCDNVTEFGCREGFTTAALALGLNDKNKTLNTYDIRIQPIHNIFKDITFPCTWKFHLKNIVEPGWEIEETDFLFVDDFHSFNQVQAELKQHGHKVKKYLGFHDTYSQGPKSLDAIGEEGILRAVQEYTRDNGWKLIYEVQFNHGLHIYQRI